MHSFSTLRAGLVVGCSLLAFLSGATAAAQPAGTGAYAAEVRDALAADDLVGAALALEGWIGLEPGRAPLHYNLGCLRARLGQSGGAVAALADAFRLGYDDVRRAAADPDLASLQGEPAFNDLLDEVRAGLERTARRSSVRLVEGEDLALPMHAGLRPEPRLRATLRFEPHALHLSLTAPRGAFPDAPEPWRAGGVVLTLAAPGPDDVFDTRNAWRFGFGRSGGLAVGAVLSRPDRAVGRRVLELAPTLDVDATAGTSTLHARVPWSYLAPYALPADSLFGVNLSYVPPRGGEIPAARLVADPARGDHGVPRRYLPLTVVPSTHGPARIAGLIQSTVIGNRPLSVDLCAWAPEAGSGRLEVEFLDNTGRSVVSSGGGGQDVELKQGRNVWRRWADLSALPQGPYRVRAMLTTPAGDVLEWRAGLFRFDGSWLNRTSDRGKPLPPSMRPSLDWRLELVAATLAERDPRTTPAPLITTVAETEAMLEAFASRGTILPESGTLTLAVPDEHGETVQVLLSEGWDPQAPPPIVILTGPSAQPLAPVLTAAAEQRGTPVIALAANSPRLDHADLRPWLAELLPGAPTAGHATSADDGRDATGLEETAARILEFLSEK